MNEDHFKMYFDFAPAFYQLSDSEVGRLIKNILRMGRGEELAPMKIKTDILFKLYVAQIKRDEEE